MTQKAMQKWQRDHFKRKVEEKMQPMIEEAELALKSIISDATEKAEKNLSKKIGADKVIKQLEAAKEILEAAQRKAKTFFKRAATGKEKKEKLKYDFTYDHDRYLNDITPEYCREQIRDWAASLARKEAYKTPVGKKRVALENIKKASLDSVMEAGIPEHLINRLDKTMNVIGITWNTQVKALPDLH